MKRFILVWAALALLLGGIAPTAVHAGTITYDIQNYPADQGGHTLSGLIITDGKIGALAASDILSWTFTVDGSATFSGGASSLIFGGDVEASPTQITLAQPPPGLQNSLQLYKSFNGAGSLSWERLTNDQLKQLTGYTSVNGLSVVWSTTPTTLGGTDPWVIAENPEPASLTPLGIGGVALLGYSWRRRRRAAE